MSLSEPEREPDLSLSLTIFLSDGGSLHSISRYVTWPGQAVGYKVGQIKILQLRQKAKERLGDKFDIKKFHDVVLECAGPLDILETKVNEYMDSTV